MTVQCAWCDTTISAPPGARTPPTATRVSDGICRTCLSHQLAALARPAPQLFRSASALR